MPQGLRELVGRAMIDPDFLADLQRAPDTILAQYQLSDDERTTVARALERLVRTPANQRAHALRNALIRRVAT
jgi:adenylate kinase